MKKSSKLFEKTSSKIIKELERFENQEDIRYVYLSIHEIDKEKVHKITCIGSNGNDLCYLIANEMCDGQEFRNIVMGAIGIFPELERRKKEETDKTDTK
jgi:hypothetical protein